MGRDGVLQQPGRFLHLPFAFGQGGQRERRRGVSFIRSQGLLQIGFARVRLVIRERKKTQIGQAGRELGVQRQRFLEGRAGGGRVVILGVRNPEQVVRHGVFRLQFEERACRFERCLFIAFQEVNIGQRLARRLALWARRKLFEATDPSLFATRSNFAEGFLRLQEFGFRRQSLGLLQVGLALIRLAGSVVRITQ